MVYIEPSSLWLDRYVCWQGCRFRFVYRSGLYVDIICKSAEKFVPLLYKNKVRKIMGIRYFFKDELASRKAISDCWNLGYWAHTVTEGSGDSCKAIIEVSELAEGLIESRFKDFII